MEAVRTHDLKTTGGRMRAMRVTKKLGAAQVAAKIGISRPTYSLYENNRRKHRDKAAMGKFAKLMDVSLDWLNEGGDTPAVLRNAPVPARRGRSPEAAPIKPKSITVTAIDRGTVIQALGIDEAKLDVMIESGVFPKPKLLFDLTELQAAFKAVRFR